MTYRAGCATFVLLLGLAALVAILPSASLASEWKTYTFSEVSIDAPADWKVIRHQRSQEIELASPDGVYSLLAFWWQPDEPLLGYTDIVAHEEFILAGRRALMIKSDFRKHGVYGLAFLEPRQDGRQFLMNLEFRDKDFAKAANLFDLLLSHVRYGRRMGGASRQFGGPDVEAESETAYVPVGDTQVTEIGNVYAVENGPTRPVILKTPSPIYIGSIQTYHWNNGRGRRPGTVALRRSDGKTFGPWKTVGKPGQGGVANAYWYAEPDFILPAGTYTVVDSDPKSWATNKAAGNKGFVRIEFRKVEEKTVPPPEEPPTMEPPPTATDEDIAPVKDGPMRADIPVGQLAKLAGGDCVERDATALVPRLKQVFHGRDGIDLQWIVTCGTDNQPVFGAAFAYDPMGQTDDFFYSFYNDLLDALGRRSFAIASLADGVLITVTADSGGVKLDYADLAITPGDGTTAPEPGTTDKALDRNVFDGRMTGAWRKLSVAGGDFAQFARFEQGELVVDVPEGHSWGKTGIWSAAPMTAFEPNEQSIAIDFTLDPARTDSVVLAVSGRDDPDDWSSHDLRLHWYRKADGSGGVAALHQHQRLITQIETGPVAPEHVRFRIDRSGAAAVSIGDRVLEAVIPGGPPPEGYRLYALAHAPEANLPARMGLRRIEIIRDVAPAIGGLDPYPGTRQEVVLFDGALGVNWVRYSAGGASFDAVARTGEHGLIIDVPAGTAWGNAGILSPEPLVWLESFHGNAEVEVTFEIDPERSDGFALALAHPGYGGVMGNPPGSPNVTFIWYRPKNAANAVADVHFNPHRDGDFVHQEVTGWPPSEVHFIIRPGEVTVEAEGMASVSQPFPTAADGAGLHIYAYSIVPEKDAPTRFVLKRVAMWRKSGPAASGAKPAPGVAPLPAKTVFSGTPDRGWETIGVAGGNFDAFAQYADGALEIDVPAGNRWGKTGILSTEPLLKLDSRVRITPARIELQLDPSRPENLNVALSANKVADMWLDHRAWYALSY